MGTATSANLKMRVNQLEKLVIMLNEMEILIRFRAIRTSELINEISEQESLNNFIFLNILRENISGNSLNISKEWRKSADKAMFLNENDKKILLSVGEQIGGTDIDGQLSMLALNKTLAERNLLEAEENLRIKGKMFRTVWGLCGLAAGIMII